MNNLLLVTLIVLSLLLLAVVIRLISVNKALVNQTTQNGLLQKAIQAASAGTFFYSTRSNETYWDENSLKMFGLAGQGQIIPPGTWERLIHPLDREKALSEIFNALNGKGQLFTHVYRILLPGGEIRWIKGTGFVVRNDQGDPLEITGFHFNITGQIRAEQKLKDSEARARQAMEAKATFLANMSHEIRTPMNAIIGMIELLQHEDPNQTQKRYLATLRNSSNVLMRIIDDILDVSKIEAGKLSLEKKPFPVRQVLHQCLSVYTQISNRKNILLTGRVDAAVPIQIQGDSSRLQQVLMNLISNAFKFTDQGHILVRVECTEQKDRLRFSVEDSGVGIAEEAQASLFERFNQVDQSASRSSGGTGLGLAIVREIVELWGGDVWIRSRSGHGATFFFDIPVQQSSRAVNQPNQRYLLCSQQEALAHLWTEDPCAPPVELVTSFTQMHSAMSSQTFDHLVVDQGFVERNGAELIDDVKRTAPHLTATLIDFETDISGQSLPDSVDSFIAKPHFLNQIWEPELWQSETESQEVTPDYSHVRVLCVDDNQSNLIVLVGLLKRLGIHAVAVDSGAKAVETALADDFDLILMDYEMPGMDGPSATRAILQKKDHLVIALSAHTEEFFKQQAQAAGMRGFLRKPIRLDAIQTMLGEHFSQQESLH
ncbi:PAS domain-containing hybrid sensor histidine kinase/response regulator [Reinekea blandensis]|uniref:Sensory/regulatory protein RpfC n=1 Tax=Reinekea blandensis MED297 TaxID=314283 RepID=A4B9L6_9GAMM|nr:PAS domain-containing hybrid sensor histidine kinase/response regulator [Reinekea blandensis]EAR11317.1 probable sensor/response regulator hybrid [Reinekea sp. MED297] [Reinekea blandensis MED297]